MASASLYCLHTLHTGCNTYQCVYILYYNDQDVVLFKVCSSVCLLLSFSCFCPHACMHTVPCMHAHMHILTACPMHTYTGVEVKFKGAFYDTLISCSQVPELNKMAVTEEGLTVGASVTLTRLEEQLKYLVESLPGWVEGGTLIVLLLK